MTLAIKKGIYKHYKNKLYEVLGISIHSETLEELVLYKALYNDTEFWEWALWVRPKEMFFENIVIDGIEKPRFEYIWDKKHEDI